jgi:hypothetical protein
MLGTITLNPFSEVADGAFEAAAGAAAGAWS